ncbi:Trans-enoyl reductase ACTTS2 [Cladobotryum mycophilum]|uniref:Trans-enoyl reductase ACTTS2 n=1 Tax=Cladobotryum mycophilum TaxID=491253 RepID=A0ABR0SW53_9HYPO
MSTQKAIVIREAGKAEVITNAPIPKLRDGYIIVKTASVALNPVDWKFIDFLASSGAIVGCDYSGIIHQIGANVQPGFQVGDRVMGMIHGCNQSNHEDGSFAEYVAAKADIQMRIPDAMSFEDAATLGAGVISMGQSLYQSLGLPLPDNPSKEKTPVLIYGGSTATGTLAIQFAKLSGFDVVATCSPRNEKLVRGMGADHVFDYNSPDCASNIKKATDDKLHLVFDAIGNEETAKLCCDAIRPEGGKYTSLNQLEKLPRKDVENLGTMAYTAVGEAFELTGAKILAKPEDLAFAKKFTKMAQDLLFKQRLKVHPPSVRSGGLRGVLDGLQEMRDGKVSGVKLVYNVE